MLCQAKMDEPPKRNCASGCQLPREDAQRLCRYAGYKPSSHLHYPFTAADKEASPTRTNERVWEQQVRNIVSQRDVEGDYIREGLLAYNPGGLSITDAGRAHIAAKGGDEFRAL